jgi:cytochrome c oxidase cbb3-type subunit 3
MSYSELLVLIMCLTAVMILGVSFVLLNVIKVFAREAINPIEFATPEEKERLKTAGDLALKLKKERPSIFVRLLGLKPIEEESSLIMEHEFDGISELNNPTPAWFMVLFYGSIIIAIIYMLNYEVLGFGSSQEQEYATELEQAATDKEAFLSKPGNAKNAVNESNIVQSKDVAVIQEGSALFQTRCTPCHGEHGQGIVGPNLTDEFWLHGGKVEEIFKTIKYGVPEKGMIAWEKSLSAAQIANLTNYILSIQGSKPANPKAPQGDKVK